MHRLHSSHLGVEGCLRRARECVYWPGMSEQIKTYVAKCDTCQQKETLHPHDVQDTPWAKVGMDLFVFENKDYLVTVDYYSKFWEVDYLPDTMSITVIRKFSLNMGFRMSYVRTTDPSISLRNSSSSPRGGSLGTEHRHLVTEKQSLLLKWLRG